MALIALIPAIFCTVALFFWPPARVFRNIVLPVIILLPLYYSFKAPLVPPIDFGDAVLIPLGIGLTLRALPFWRYTLMDLWLILFVISTGVADRLAGYSTGSTFELFDSVSKILVPYMAGKLLIEQDGNRAATLKRIVTLMVVAAIPSFYEVFWHDNLYRAAFQPYLFANSVWLTQMRNGFGRLAGPYAQAELAGMVFLVGAVFALFLARYFHWGERFRHAPWLPVRKSTLVIAVLLLALILTQSRGPELGILIAIPIALVGRSRRVLRSIFIAVVFAAVVGSASYVAIMRYTDTQQIKSEDQSSAVYRKILLDNYLPLAEHGGPWGRGLSFLDYHAVGAQASIDNEYLFVWITQGYVGIAAFLLLVGGTLTNLVLATIYSPQKIDRSFAFTLLGIFVGLLFVVATVFLGVQALIFFFLIVGWSQTLRTPPAERKHPALQQVYT
jgi:hypothetical protein